MILRVHSNLKDSVSSKQLLLPLKVFLLSLFCFLSWRPSTKKLLNIFNFNRTWKFSGTLRTHTFFLVIYLTYLLGKSCLWWDSGERQEREPMAENTCKMSHFQATAVRELSYASCSYHCKCHTKGSGRQRQPTACIYHKAFIHTFTVLPLAHLPNIFICLLQPTHVWRKSMALWPV